MSRACRRDSLQTPWGGEREGGFIRCLGAFDPRVPLSSPHRGVETAHRSRQQTNKDGSQRDIRHLLQHHRPDLCHLAACTVLWLWPVSPVRGRSLAVMELWVQEGRMWGEDGLYAFSSACGFLRRQTLLLPLQTHCPKAASRMILSDCFSIWAMNNTRAGIHLQPVFSILSTENGHHLVLSCRAHTHSVSLFCHSRTNHGTKGSPRSASCRKEGSSLSLPAVQWAKCLTAPSGGKKISTITHELICTGTHVLHCSWPAGATPHHPDTGSGGCKRLT